MELPFDLCPECRQQAEPNNHVYGWFGMSGHRALASPSIAIATGAFV
jgi:hypothetical protein